MYDHVPCVLQADSRELPAEIFDVDFAAVRQRDFVFFPVDCLLLADPYNFDTAKSHRLTTLTYRASAIKPLPQGFPGLLILVVVHKLEGMPLLLGKISVHPGPPSCQGWERAGTHCLILFILTLMLSYIR